jgi:hypothetical protein
MIDADHSIRWLRKAITAYTIIAASHGDIAISQSCEPRAVAYALLHQSACYTMHMWMLLDSAKNLQSARTVPLKKLGNSILTMSSRPFGPR